MLGLFFVQYGEIKANSQRLFWIDLRVFLYLKNNEGEMRYAQRTKKSPVKSYS